MDYILAYYHAKYIINITLFYIFINQNMKKNNVYT